MHKQGFCDLPEEQSDRALITLSAWHRKKGRSKRWLCRILVAIAALGFSGLVGAGTTIKTVVAYDALACRQFLSMVKAAGVPEMSDAQLCDFRFERLPSSERKHFTDPLWKSLDVKDPAAMYRRMRKANLQGPQTADGRQWRDLMKAAMEAAADHNLGFYTTQVQLQGRGAPVTVVKMDILRKCSNLPEYMQHMGVPYYAIYKDTALQHPLGFWIPHESWQMMLWENKGLNIPVLLTVFPDWVPPPNGYFNQITLNTLVLSKAKSGEYHDTVYNYGRCAYNLSSETKPTGAVAPVEPSEP